MPIKAHSIASARMALTFTKQETPAAVRAICHHFASVAVGVRPSYRQEKS